MKMTFWKTTVRNDEDIPTENKDKSSWDTEKSKTYHILTLSMTRADCKTENVLMNEK